MMKKTITTEEALNFLNLCAATDPRNTTELFHKRNIADAVKGLFSEDGDKTDSIQINRSKTGSVIGFSEPERPKKQRKADKPKGDKKKKDK